MFEEVSFRFFQPVVTRFRLEDRLGPDQRGKGSHCLSLSLFSSAPVYRRYALSVRSEFYFEARHHCPSRLTVTVSDCGRLIGKHTFPNWISVVHHLSRKRNILPNVLPRAIETSGLVEYGDSEENTGRLLLSLCCHLDTHTYSQVPFPTCTSLVLILQGHPQETVGTIYLRSLHTRPHRSIWKTRNPNWSGEGAIRRHLLLEITNAYPKKPQS